MSDLFKAANLPGYLKEKFEEEIWTKEDRYSDHLQELIGTIRANVVLDFNNKMQALAEEDNYKAIIEKMNGTVIHEDECGKLWQCEKIRPATDEASFFYNEKEDQYTLVCQDAEPPLLVVEVVNRTAEPDGSFNVYFLPVHHELRPIPNPLEVQNIVDNDPIKLQIEELNTKIERARVSAELSRYFDLAKEYIRARHPDLGRFAVEGVDINRFSEVARINLTPNTPEILSSRWVDRDNDFRPQTEPNSERLAVDVPLGELRRMNVRSEARSTFTMGGPIRPFYDMDARIGTSQDMHVMDLMHQRVQLSAKQTPKTEDELGYGPVQKLTARNAVASTFGLIGEEYQPAIET